MKTTIEDLLLLLANYKGRIESTASLTVHDIEQAKVSNRLFVDEYSLGYVWSPDFPKTDDEVEAFEKWYPLESEMPEELNNIQPILDKIDLINKSKQN